MSKFSSPRGGEQGKAKPFTNSNRNDLINTTVQTCLLFTQTS